MSIQIPIVTTANDSQEFVNLISKLSTRIAEVYAPEALFSMRVDGWFGFKWLGFSGKVLGAIGIWSNRDTLPPFVPARIEGQRKFSAPTYIEVDAEPLLHRKLPSDTARKRAIREVAPNAAVIWYSGNTKAAKRGSAMAYIPSGEEYVRLYLEWKDNHGWELSRVNGMSRSEFDAFLNSVHNEQELTYRRNSPHSTT